MKRVWNNRILGAAMTLPGLVGIVTTPATNAAVSMVEYTSYPLFVSRTMPPDNLLTIDLSDAMLPATFGNYSLLCPSSGVVGATYAGSYKGTGVTITNWPAIRKIDQAKRILIGEKVLSASNHDGTAKAFPREPKTGQYGNTSTCINRSVQ